MSKTKIRTTPKMSENDRLVAELEAIKRLLKLFLLKAGGSQGEIAMALEVDQSKVSRMIPARKIKRFESH